ncbi:M28 family peptidase [Pontibacter mangrovi]|uniref:M28 family peptidase n=2 Tax=Pontibacter mangrovi TaxID=2589816 RepID=A0A501W488_9BACT|nr:M28 family peptidase [Pontibacter mangrovi]
MGLQPLSGQSYFQEFSFPVNRIVETPQLQVNGRQLVPGQDFVARSSSASGAGKAKVLPLDTLVFTDAGVAQKFFRRNFSKVALVYALQDQKRLAQLPPQYKQKLQEAKLHIILQPKNLLTTVARQQDTLPILEVLQSAWPQQAKKVHFSVTADLNPQHQAQNVASFINGSEHPDSVLVFTAHYDHLGSQGQDVYFPGANDNASGTTMLLELAQYYSRPENQPKYSMAFIAFAAEEAGLLGSLYYVQHPLFPLQRISFLLNLDLLGTGDEGLMVVNGQVHTQEFALLQRLNEQHQYLPQIKSRGKAANSDHYPFSEAGVPAFFFYTLGGTAAYHNPQDHAQQLPLTKFQEVFRLITDFAAARMHHETE